MYPSTDMAHPPVVFVVRKCGVHKGICFGKPLRRNMEMVVLSARKGNTTRARPVVTRGHGWTGVLVLEVLQAVQSVLARVFRGPTAGEARRVTVHPVTAGNTRAGVLVVVLRAVVGTTGMMALQVVRRALLENTQRRVLVLLVVVRALLENTQRRVLLVVVRALLETTRRGTLLVVVRALLENTQRGALLVVVRALLENTQRRVLLVVVRALLEHTQRRALLVVVRALLENTQRRVLVVVLIVELVEAPFPPGALQKTVYATLGMLLPTQVTAAPSASNVMQGMPKIQ